MGLHDANRDQKEVATPALLPTMLVAAADEAASKQSDDAWMDSLTADEQSDLKQELSRLDKKSQKEQALALKDGEGAAEFMRKEYARKTADTISNYKKKAAANQAAKKQTVEKAKAAQGTSAKHAKKVTEQTDSTPSSKGGSAAANDADTTPVKTSKEDPNATPQVLSLAAGGNLLDNLPITCLLSLSAIASLGMFVRRRHLGQEAALRQEAALLNDPSPV